MLRLPPPLLVTAPPVLLMSVVTLPSKVVSKVLSRQKKEEIKAQHGAKPPNQSGFTVTEQIQQVLLIRALISSQGFIN